MTLRQKTLLIISVTLLCLLMTLYLSLSTIWLNGFAKIESQQTHRHVERVIEALDNDLRELNRTAGDWAAWDETYAFVKDGNKSYIQENLSDPTVANLRLNVMVFIYATGRTTYSKGLDLQEELAVPVSDSLRQYLATNPRFLQHGKANSSYTGIVLLPEGPLLIASQPILNNDRTSPSRGTLLFGRFLDTGEVKRLQGVTQSLFAVYPFQDTQLPNDLRAVRNELSQEASNSKTSVRPIILVRPLSSKRIAGYTLLRDIEGQPGLLLRLDIPRDIYQQGKQRLPYLVGALLALGLAFGLGTLWLIEKSVLSPLEHFSAAVRYICASGDLSGRLLTSGRDELSRPGSAINQLLATLQQSQLQLSQSEERYRSVVNNVTEVIFQTDASGRWKFLNPSWTEITGFGIEESLGKPCWKFIHPEDQAHHSKQFRRLIQGKIQDTRYEIRYQTQDGSYRWFEVHARFTVMSCDALTKVAVGIVGTAGTLNDITERKLAQARERKKARELEQTLRELRQTQAQLIQSEKMSSLGQLVAGIAHEINNPVSFVYGNIDYANQYIQDLLRLIHCYQQHYPSAPAEIKAEMEAIDFEFLVHDLPNLLDSMKVGAERICEIVKSLRNFSRIDEAEIKEVDLHEGIDSTLLILQHRLKATGKQTEIQLIKKYGNLPYIECYPGQLNQVWMNLIANAIDALEEKREVLVRMESGGEISTVSPCIQIYTEVKNGDSPDGAYHAVPNDPATSVEKADSKNVATASSCKAATLSRSPTPTRIVIRIADNGSGMSEVVQRRLFDPFFTTKPIGKGTGLGLSMSYQIVVEKHKGQLLVNSEFGQGTEFTIELPLRQSC